MPKEIKPFPGFGKERKIIPKKESEINSLP